jgi:hypothetical protein
MRSQATAAVAAALAVTLLHAAAAHAARPFIYRDLVLPRGDVALDLGLGFGHAPEPLGPTVTGLGMNLEIAVGVARDAEIGVRTGFRLNDAGQRTQADTYGRPFDTETYGVASDRVANPEFHARWSVARGPSAELGVELRAILPIEAGSHFGMVIGLPIALRTGVLRLDTGLFVPVIFEHPTLTIISVPAHLWIQVSSTLWLGPLLGLRFVDRGGSGHTEYPVGVGIGTLLSHAVDLRAWFLFPDVNNDRTYGGGVALQIRFD